MESMSHRLLVGVASIACALVGPPGCTPSQQVCGEEQEARITSFVADLSAALEANAITTDIELPRVLAEGAPIPLDGILAELDHRGLRIGAEHVAQWRSRSWEPLDEAVIRMQVLAEAMGRTAEPVLVAAIAADVPARDVGELLGIAERVGFVRVAFVAAAGNGPEIPAMPEPELPAMIRERSGGDPMRELEVLGQLLEVEAARCPPLGETSSHGSVAPADLRARAILAFTKDALIACHCAANVDRVLSLAHFHVAPTQVTVLSPERSFPSAGPVVLGRPDAPWSEVVPSVFERE